MNMHVVEKIKNSLKRQLVKGTRSVVLVAFAGVALGMSPNTYAKDKLKVVTSIAGLIFSPLYVAKQLGYFDAEGLDVTIIDGNGGSNAVAGVLGKSSDIAVVGIKNASQAVEKGQSLKVFATGTQGFPQILVVREDLAKQAKLPNNASLTDKAAILRNRVIAVTDIGGSTGQFARLVLKSANISDNEIKLINVPTIPGQLSALKAGRIDAFVNASPVVEVATTEGYGRKLIDPAFDLKNVTDFEYTVQVARDDVLQEKSQALERYLRAIQKAYDTIHTNSAQARNAVFTYFADSAEITQAFPEAIRNIAWENTLPYFPRTVSLDDNKIKAARSFFDVSDKVTNAALIDNRLAEKVQAQHRPTK